MKRGAAVCVAWVAIVLAAPLARGQEAAGPKPQTLYQRLGGFDRLAALFDATAPKMATDPQLARFFSGHATDSDMRQRQMLLELLCQESGGACTYTGRPLEKAHGGLGITGADWSAFEKHFGAAMNELKVGEQEQSELLSLVRRYKSDIVEKP